MYGITVIIHFMSSFSQEGKEVLDNYEVKMEPKSPISQSNAFSSIVDLIPCQLLNL